MTPPIATSLTAWGSARPLTAALADAVAHARDGIVQLAIGARPVDDPYSVLSNAPVTLIAHHAVPLAPRRMLRPTSDPTAMVEALSYLNITRYSAHPPARRHADCDELWSWASRWHTALARAGISFALETMYPTDDPDDPGFGPGWHLDSPSSVARFCDQALRAGWDAPLVVDGAHLHIGQTAGVWSPADVAALAERCRTERLCAEAHVSANDGRRDRHEPPGARPGVDSFVWALALSLDPLVIVDEGRRPVPPTRRDPLNLENAHAD